MHHKYVQGKASWWDIIYALGISHCQSKLSHKKSDFLITSDMTPIIFRVGLGQLQLSVARSTKNVMGKGSTHSHYEAVSLKLG